MNNLLIINTIKESYLLIFKNYKKLFAPIFLFISLSFCYYINIQYFLKTLKENDSIEYIIIEYVLMLLPLLPILLPIAFISMVLAEHKTNNIQLFISKPYKVLMEYGYRLFAPILLCSFIFIISEFIEKYLGQFFIIFLYLIAIYPSIKISMSPILLTNAINKKIYDDNNSLSSEEWSFIKSWKITNGNFIKISLIMFLANLPITIFVIFRYIYLTINTHVDIKLPFFPHSHIIGGDHFISFFFTGLNSFSYILNFFTIFFLIFSVLISLSVRTVILKKLT
jgi:hypothetical protein